MSPRSIPLPRSGPVDWLLEAPNGDLWLSVLGGGLQRRDGESGKVLDDVAESSGLTALDTEAIRIGPDGALWLAGAQGPAALGPATASLRSRRRRRRRARVLVRLPGRQPSMAAPPVRPGAVAPPGRRLAKREQRLAVAQGVPAVESTGLAAGRSGRPWLATRRGLFRIDPQTASVRGFGVRDGLSSQEFTDRALLITA